MGVVKMFSASAPGSLMLFGEHAVLHGKHAICCAIDQRIRVNLTPRNDRRIGLSSAALGSYQLDLDELAIHPPFQFVLAAIDHYRPQIRQGFDLSINAEFSSTMGLGSSSAVTVATLAALAQWLDLSLSAHELFHAARAVVLRVQGVGSGADVAAAVFGGIVAYRAEPIEIESFALTPELALVYSGAKVPTSTVIQMVAEKQRAEPVRYQRLYDDIGACVNEAVAALRLQNWPLLGELMGQHHELQAALGVSTPLLDELVTDLRRQRSVYGAKISGSGLGDCVVGLGNIPGNIFPANPEQQRAGVKQIPVKISKAGYQTH